MLNVILFFGTYVLGFLLTIFQNPAFSFVLYEVVYFFNPVNRWWSYNIPDISYSFFTVVLMVFSLFIIYRKYQTKNKIFAPPQFKWVYLILLLYATAWFNSVNPEEHSQATIYFLKLVIIISIAYKLIDTSEKFDYAIWGYIFGSWYISFLTYQTGRNVGNRVEGIGTVDSPDANGIAAAIAPSLVLCLCYFWTIEKKYFKLLFALAGIFIANALVLINSRGAFLAAFFGIIYFMYYMYFSSLQRRFQKTAAVFISIMGISGAIYLADDTTINRIISMTNTEITTEKQSGSTRIIFWMSALEMAKDHPFGAGFQGFDYYAPYYLPEDVDTGSSRNRSVHSTWFEALSEVGYLGLLLLILMLYASFKATRKCIFILKGNADYENYFKIIALEAALLSFIVAMSFMNRFRAEILYWLILYTACAYNIYVIKPLDKGKVDADSNQSSF